MSRGSALTCFLECAWKGFEYRAVMKRVKNIKNGKAAGTFHVHPEMLKWTAPVVKEWICIAWNQEIAKDWDKTLYKGGNGNQVGSCGVKLLSNILEQQLNKWTERAPQKSCGRSRFATKTQHYHYQSTCLSRGDGARELTSRSTIVLSFVKPIPRPKLWERMEKYTYTPSFGH